MLHGALEKMGPDAFHVIPVCDDVAGDGVLQGENPAARYRADECIVYA
jgi:hypothetical protein